MLGFIGHGLWSNDEQCESVLSKATCPFLKQLKIEQPYYFVCFNRFYDTSKQALGAGVIHMANVFLSSELFQGDPCIW